MNYYALVLLLSPSSIYQQTLERVSPFSIQCLHLLMSQHLVITWLLSCYFTGSIFTTVIHNLLSAKAKGQFSSLFLGPVTPHLLKCFLLLPSAAPLCPISLIIFSPFSFLLSPYSFAYSLNWHFVLDNSWL